MLPRENNIEVAVSHEFHNSVPATIRTYYGMQSMFCDETHTLTPTEPMPTDPAGRGFHFTKGDYPAFRRFVEKTTAPINRAGCCPKVQATTPGSTIRTRYSSATLRQELPPALARQPVHEGTGCTGAASHLVHLPDRRRRGAVVLRSARGRATGAGDRLQTTLRPHRNASRQVVAQAAHD
ncbi:MAG: hypothetical protein ACLRM8_09875 [Alistipes sp.]